MDGRMSQHNTSILNRALIRYDACSAAQSHIHLESRDDFRFVYNIDEGQWPAHIRAERARDNRVCLTSNKLRKFVSVVANQLITSRPAMGVIPVDDLSDPGVAKVLEGLIRNIEYRSMAQQIYQQTLEHAVAIGFGYWRILTKYNEDSWNQDIYLEGIDDPFSVALDPDGEYGFLRVSLSQDEFKAKYPGATIPDTSRFTGIYTHWADKDRVYVCEYYWKEPITVQLAQVTPPGGTQIETIQIPKNMTPEEMQAQGYVIHRMRKQPGHQVKWATITATDILDERNWPGKDIPIIEVCGDKQLFEGKWYKRSLIRDAKDPARMYNFWLTAQTEAGALIPKAPYLLTPEMVRGHEAMWDSANRTNRTYLLYNQAGQRVPNRERPPEVSSGGMSMLKVADSDIKDVIGIFEPGLGDVSNERSGRAIKMRQSRSDLTTGHFQEQFNHALIRTAKQFIDLIPKIQDTAQMVRLLGEDGTSSLVPINHTVVDPVTQLPVVVNDLSVGRFDVEASVKVYQTRREEAAEMMVQALQYAGPVAPYLLPLVFKYSNWPGADEVKAIVERVLSAQATQTPSPDGTTPNASPGGAPSMPMSPMASPTGA